MTIRELIDKLHDTNDLSSDELKELLTNCDPANEAYLEQKARETAVAVYEKKIYVRGLIEFTNHCRNNCLYCGIRAKNPNIKRYRLSDDDVISCCEKGYALGYRTFVMQGGEDVFYTDDKITAIVTTIKKRFPDCAVTLSIGEKSRESYEKFHEAGADRYLLRHETADEKHYEKLHERNQSFANRMRCLRDLKDIGFQTGCGFMVGSPYQTIDHLVKDLRFIKKFNPEMVGIGPFIPHSGTPFAAFPSGSADMTVKLLAIVRLLLPYVLLPATTALATVDKNGRKRGILAGANVIMPNLSPADKREFYSLYDRKACTGNEAAEMIAAIEKEITDLGYELSRSRGDGKKPDTARKMLKSEI